MSPLKRLALPLALLFTAAGLATLGATAAPAHAAPPPTTITGRVVDPITHAGVAGVVVTARDVVALGTVYARATSGPQGYFKLTGVTVEEVATRFNGASVSYETGWLSCNRTVVPTWGQGCSNGTGWIGFIRIDHL